MWGFFLSKNLGVKKFYRDTGSGGIKWAIYFNCVTIAPLIQNRDDRRE
jgi:hypothetical protein